LLGLVILRVTLISWLVLL